MGTPYKFILTLMYVYLTSVQDCLNKINNSTLGITNLNIVLLLWHSEIKSDTSNEKTLLRAKRVIKTMLAEK
jgi:hypothetical protein